jgi:hypothetical protein
MIEVSYRRNGFIIRLEGEVNDAQMRECLFQMRDEWAGLDVSFVVLVDARSFKHFSADAQASFQQLMTEASEEGMLRVTVLGISTALASLFCSIFVQTDLMDLYQFLDLAYETDWKNEMKAWLDAPFHIEAEENKA